MKKKEIAKGIYCIEDFLTPEKCDELIDFSEQRGYTEALVSIDGQQRKMTAIRNNERILYKNDFWASYYWEKLQKLGVRKIGNSKPIGLNELFKFYKYTNHQRFKKHRDGSYIRNETEFSLETFMVYLNDDFEGGHTKFEQAEIIPKKGMALVFQHELKHEGQAIISGTKYVLRSDIMYQFKDNYEL